MVWIASRILRPADVLPRRLFAQGKWMCTLPAVSQGGSARKVSKCDLDVWLSLKRQSASKTYPLWPRPCAHTQRYHRDSSLRLSCNLGRCVTSSFCGSLFSAGVLRDPNAFRPFSRVDCCVQPDIKLGMIVHPFPSLEVQQNLRAIPRHVCPTAFRLCQPANVEYHTMPTTCWFGLHTAPMSENSICR